MQICAYSWMNGLIRVNPIITVQVNISTVNKAKLRVSVTQMDIPSQIQQTTSLQHVFFFFSPFFWIKHIDLLQVASQRDECQGFGFLHCAVSLAVIHVMYWPFAIHWLRAMVRAWTLNLDHQITSASLPGSPMARYQPLLQRLHLHSRCQFVLETLIYDDGWGDAWKSRASQTTHQDILITPADEWQLQFLNLTAKSKNRTSLSTKDVSFIPSTTKPEFCQTQITS